jgi:hypothetical protein
MNWDRLAKKLAAAGFTAVGGAMAGPAGAAVGAKVAAVFGVDAEPDVIARAIVADPEAEIALRRLDQEILKDERAYLERTLAAERDERAVMRSTAPPVFLAYMTGVVFVVIACMACALVYAVLFHGEDWTSEQWDFVKFISPLLIGGCFVSAVAYFIGSSSGSASKERIMAEERK